MRTGKLTRISRHLFFAVGLIAQINTNALAEDTSKTLDVGVVLRMEDKFNTSVNAIRNGIEIAKLLFEKHHPSVKIHLKHYTHTEELASVVTAADQVIADQLPAVIGAEMSHEAIVLGDKFSPEKTVFITPTASNPSVTQGKPYTFRACFSDQQLADKLAYYVAKSLHPKAVGLIRNTSFPYSDYLSSEFATTFHKIDGADKIPVIEQQVLKDHLNFENEIKTFKAAGVTHVAVLSYQSDFLRFALQAADQGYFPVYIGSDGWGSNDNIYQKLVLESSGRNKFEAYRNSYWKETGVTPMVKEFKSAFQAKYKVKPDAWNAVAFDSAWILFTAMNRVKNPKDRSAIQAQMLKLKDLHLITTNHFSFGEGNSPNKDLFIYRINKKGVQYEATL